LPVINTLDTAQFLIFQIAQRRCAALLSSFCQIIRVDELPKTFECIDLQAAIDPRIGSVISAGETAPVLPLSGLLSSADRATSCESHVLIVKTPLGSLGFLIAHVERILAVSTSRISALDLEQARPFFSTKVPHEKSFVEVMDLQAFALHCRAHPDHDFPTLFGPEQLRAAS
jgi:chemotaxis signal transduction protein